MNSIHFKANILFQQVENERYTLIYCINLDVYKIDYIKCHWCTGLLENFNF